MVHYYGNYDYNKHYDFIKSDEAKEIFLNLKKEEWLNKNQGYDKEDLRKYFSYDEEKKSIVKDFILPCSVCQDHIENLRKHEKNRSYERYYRDLDEFQSEFVKTISLKKGLDPEYIYEHWQAEKLRFFDEMDRNCKDKNNEKYCKQNEFILDSL